MKALLRLLLRLLFGFRVYNEEVLQTPGPVLLIPNHVSWLDWLFLYACCDQDWRCVVSRSAAQRSWLHRRIAINRRTYPVDPDSPYAVKHMREHLQAGNRLVLFAEGRLSRTGSLMKLFEGTGFLLYKTQAKIITCYIRGAQRLPWSAHPGWKKLSPRVTLHFSHALLPPRSDYHSTVEARTRLTDWLRDRLVEQQFNVEMSLGAPTIPDAIAEIARQRPAQIVLEDFQRQPLTYRRLLIAADLLSRQWRTLLPLPEERVGILLPNVIAMPVVLLSLWLGDQVPAILNYSAGVPTMLACARLTGLTRIITSRTFVERARLNVAPFEEAGIKLIYLEDVRAGISASQKLFALLRHRSSLGPGIRTPHAAERTAVILFTSGSEGMPKGVELTHGNLLANIRQMLAVIDLLDSDRFFNALPLFHSFGLTVGTLLPLVRGLYVFLYPSPLHYRVVPTAFYNLDCTALFATNTFLNGYARKAHPYDFWKLRFLFAGAEKLQEATASTWAQRFGVRVLEGYGATECSPCLSANTPLAPKHGSAGRFLPGIEYKLEPVEGVGEGGRLLVRGPNVMRGYVNPEANAKFKSLGGWYDTGDIVKLDSEGYLHILGRLKRFAKVSGEMVSLAAVEEALAGAFPQYGLHCQVAVLSRTDEEKGEALIAVTNESKLHLEEIRTAIKAKGLANLCVPREIKYVREIPVLGSGKIDHRELARII